MKTTLYIDGYNLYYGCLKHTPHKWLDIDRLFKRIVHEHNPADSVERIRFFTADIKAKIATNGQEASQAQQAYHRALLQLYPTSIEIVKGYYSLDAANLPVYKQPPDKNDRVKVWKLEEKQTDVSIALESYRDAAKGLTDQLVFVTNDTDVEPALKAIKQDFPERHIGVIYPIREDVSGRPGNGRLNKYADWVRRSIRDLELAESQLPEQVPTRKKPIKKPNYW